MEEIKPKLVQKNSFEAKLASYRPSPDAIESLTSARALFLVGPSGSGRNTLIERLVDTELFYYVLSDTTRPRRMQGDRLEHDGEFYWHISEDAFLQGLERGDYLEAAVIHNQQVSGSNSTEYRKASQQNKVAVTDIEGIHGPPVFHDYSEKAQFIFMVPPGFDVWMERLKQRGAMSPEELHRRLISAQKEITAALERPYYHFLVSRDLDHNVQSVINITAGRPSLDPEDVAKQQAEELLLAIKKYTEMGNF